MTLLTIVHPVVDLRRSPEHLFPRDYSHHPLRESQLLYGETVKVLEEKGSWLFVEALEQEKFTEERSWHFYPGWVHSSEVATITSKKTPNAVVVIPWAQLSPHPLSLSFGTKVYIDEEGKIELPNGLVGTCPPGSVRKIPSTFNAQLLLADAEKFLGFPYLWGGRSSHSPDFHASSDCSGLTNLVYRAQGIEIPRDAHDQYLRAKKIPSEEMRPGDLIFLTRTENPRRMTHVVIYTKDNCFIEAPESGKHIRHFAFITSLCDVVQMEGRPYLYNAHYASFQS